MSKPLKVMGLKMQDIDFDDIAKIATTYIYIFPVFLPEMQSLPKEIKMSSKAISLLKSYPLTATNVN